MNKKIFSLMIVGLMTLMLVAPAMAVVPQGPGEGPYPVDTSVTVNSAGGGDPPLVKCKWETTSDIVHEDDDPATPGIQIDPILGGCKAYYIWAVVTDPDGVGTIEGVHADVYHPMGDWKYQVELDLIETDGTAARAIFDAAYDDGNGEVTLNNGAWIWPGAIIPTDIVEDIREELYENIAKLYHGVAYLSYCQPAGDYRVDVFGIDSANLWSHDHIPAWNLENYFTYVPTIGLTIDFDTLNYGGVDVCTPKTLPGDDDMSSPNLPTVQNGGNVPLNIFVENDAMGIPPEATGPNVEFAVKLGGSGVLTWYYPDTPTQIPEVLGLCTKIKLDYGIHVIKATGGGYTGTMEVWAEQEGSPPYVTAPYEPCPP